MSECLWCRRRDTPAMQAASSAAGVFATAPPQTSELKNSSLNCFLNAPYHLWLQVPNKTDLPTPKGVRMSLVQKKGHACNASCVLGGRCFCNSTAPDFGAKNSSPNCFLNAPHPLRVQVPNKKDIPTPKGVGMSLVQKKGLEPSRICIH